MRGVFVHELKKEVVLCMCLAAPFVAFGLSSSTHHHDLTEKELVRWPMRGSRGGALRRTARRHERSG